jgi:hypothetical protein
VNNLGPLIIDVIGSRPTSKYLAIFLSIYPGFEFLTDKQFARESLHLHSDVKLSGINYLFTNIHLTREIFLKSTMEIHQLLIFDFDNARS